MTREHEYEGIRHHRRRAGQADKLVDLLKKLGYRHSDGAWGHPERIAVFVGDLIDRGPHQLATINIVRPMVATGAAGDDRFVAS